MNKVRYFIGLLVFIAIFSLLVYGAGGNLFILLDVLSIVITAVLTIVLLRTGWTFREMGKAFSAAFDEREDKPSLSVADAFFTAMGRYQNLSAVLGTVTGVIITMRYLTDKTQLGPNLALALLSILYAVLLQLAVVVPMRAMIQKKLK